MRGATYYALQDNVKLYSSPAIGTVVSTLSKNDEAGVSTGNITSTDGDLFIELVRLSDQKKLYAIESQVGMNSEYGGNTLPIFEVKADKLKPIPVWAYVGLGALLFVIGLVAATKLKR